MSLGSGSGIVEVVYMSKCGVDAAVASSISYLVNIVDLCLWESYLGALIPSFNLLWVPLSMPLNFRISFKKTTGFTCKYIKLMIQLYVVVKITWKSFTNYC